MLGGKDNLKRDNDIILNKVKTGFLKTHNYSNARNYFISCFESAVSDMLIK